MHGGHFPGNLVRPGDYLVALNRNAGYEQLGHSLRLMRRPDPRRAGVMWVTILRARRELFGGDTEPLNWLRWTARAATAIASEATRTFDAGGLFSEWAASSLRARGRR